MIHHPSSNIEISRRMSFIPFSVWGMDNGIIKGRDCSKPTCTDKQVILSGLTFFLRSLNI